MQNKVSARISIVVPVLNELKTLTSKYDYFRQIEAGECELIFVDGGSSDGSGDFLKSHFRNVYFSAAGRATQMNLGAAQATGRLLLFLHVDTYLPLLSLSAIAQAKSGGFCLLHLTGQARIFRLIERGINWRSRVFKVATGDQCLFFESGVFKRLGGYPDQPLMEDIELARRFKKIASPTIIKAAVTSSSRRWEKHGVLKTVLLMWWLQLLYRLGVSPHRLARYYLGRPATNQSEKTPQ